MKKKEAGNGPFKKKNVVYTILRNTHLTKKLLNDVVYTIMRNTHLTKKLLNDVVN